MILLHDCAHCLRAVPRDLVVPHLETQHYSCGRKRTTFPAAIACPDYRPTHYGRDETIEDER